MPNGAVVVIVKAEKDGHAYAGPDGRPGGRGGGTARRAVGQRKAAVSGHQAIVPEVARAYFERYVPYGGRPDHPVIIQEFRPGRGWITTGFRKRVSGAWLRKLRREGVTHVALAAQGRRADFTVAELLKHQKGQS